MPTLLSQEKDLVRKKESLKLFFLIAVKMVTDDLVERNFQWNTEEKTNCSRLSK